MAVDEGIERIVATLRDLHLSVPDDVSVVSFDEPEWSQLVTPTLSTIRQPAKHLARTAWQLLADRFTDRVSPPRIMSMRALFIPRDSVAPPRQMCDRIAGLC